MLETILNLAEVLKRYGLYTEIAIEARYEAVNRMLREASEKGANAVLGLKFESDNMGGGNGSSANGTIAYGTAVLVG